MIDPLPIALLITGTFLLAGAGQRRHRPGPATVAMGLLGLTMQPAEAAAILLMPSPVTNVWQLLAGPPVDRVLRRLWPMMLGVIVGTLAGSGIIAGTAPRAATAGLGVALLL